MSQTTKHTCGDCHYIALRRHLSNCSKSCGQCALYKREAYVCKNRVRDYCTNENVAGTIDRTYPACDSDFELSGTSALIMPLERLSREHRKEQVA